jgi:hypothetical protein
MKKVSKRGKPTKKKLWVLFSIFIRMRDCLATTGSIYWGLCITCKKRYHFKMLQAGHFVAGRHNAGLFSEKGTHAQCYNCNINLKGNTLVYRREIIKMYGEGVDLELETQMNQVLQLKEFQIGEMMEHYKQEIKKLEEQNKIPEGQING